MRIFGKQFFDEANNKHIKIDPTKLLSEFQEKYRPGPKEKEALQELVKSDKKCLAIDNFLHGTHTLEDLRSLQLPEGSPLYKYFDPLFPIPPRAFNNFYDGWHFPDAEQTGPYHFTFKKGENGQVSVTIFNRYGNKITGEIRGEWLKDLKHGYEEYLKDPKRGKDFPAIDYLGELIRDIQTLEELDRERLFKESGAPALQGLLAKRETYTPTLYLDLHQFLDGLDRLKKGDKNPEQTLHNLERAYIKLNEYPFDPEDKLEVTKAFTQLYQTQIVDPSISLAWRISSLSSRLFFRPDQLKTAAQVGELRTFLTDAEALRQSTSIRQLVTNYAAMEKSQRGIQEAGASEIAELVAERVGRNLSDPEKREFYELLSTLDEIAPIQPSETRPLLDAYLENQNLGSFFRPFYFRDAFQEYVKTLSKYPELRNRVLGGGLPPIRNEFPSAQRIGELSTLLINGSEANARPYIMRIVGSINGEAKSLARLAKFSPEEKEELTKLHPQQFFALRAFLLGQGEAPSLQGFPRLKILAKFEGVKDEEELKRVVAEVEEGIANGTIDLSESILIEYDAVLSRFPNVAEELKGKLIYAEAKKRNLPQVGREVTIPNGIAVQTILEKINLEKKVDAHQQFEMDLKRTAKIRFQGQEVYTQNSDHFEEERDAFYGKVRPHFTPQAWVRIERYCNQTLGNGAADSLGPLMPSYLIPRTASGQDVKDIEIEITVKEGMVHINYTLDMQYVCPPQAEHPFLDLFLLSVNTAIPLEELNKDIH